jgi:hypothetical protein
MREEQPADHISYPLLSGSIFIRMMDNGRPEGMFPGELVECHRHNFDHTSIFFCGDWRVRKWTPDDVLEHDFTRAGPFHLLIDKDCLHEFTFLGGAERGLAWCVYSHRTPNGEVVRESTGWPDAYGLKDEGADYERWRALRRA